MPAINKPSNHFNATLYTGTGTNAVGITGVGFQTDFNWTKSRSSASYTHQLSDSVRGFSKYLYSSATTTEGTDASNHIQSVNSDGYVINSGASFNASGVTFVSWNWKAGGTAVTNTSGTISSQVSANPTAGFSVCTYTAPASSQVNTFGHGLGVAPSMVIAKNRSSGTGGLGWAVYHASLGVNQVLSLNTTAGAATVSGYWGSGMTSSVVSLVTSASSDGYDNCTGNMVAYCFAPIAGYSAFGSYTGNGSTDGPFVYTGFRPRFVMLKKTSNATNSNWLMQDTSRETYNASNYATLAANLTNLEPQVSAGSFEGNFIDYLSNGFKIRSSGSNSNESSSNYIYMAFAEAPFKFANGR
jgi:hypothetical protein